MDESSFVKLTSGSLTDHNSSINEKVISREDLPTSARSLFQRTKDARHNRTPTLDATCGMYAATTRWNLTTTTTTTTTTSDCRRRVRGDRRGTTGRRRRSLRVSSGIEEETNFAPIDAGDSESAPGGVAESRFGPEVTLLVGFTSEETKEWRRTLDEIGADFVEVKTLTAAMRRGTLGAALETKQADASAEKPALGVPRVMFLSGMSGSEVMEIIDEYDGKEWAPCVFACAVPKNWDTDVASLTAEIMDDHLRLTGGGGGGDAACET